MSKRKDYNRILYSDISQVKIGANVRMLGTDQEDDSGVVKVIDIDLIPAQIAHDGVSEFFNKHLRRIETNVSMLEDADYNIMERYDLKYRAKKIAKRLKKLFKKHNVRYDI